MRKLAVLSCGLPEWSRTMRKAAGVKVDMKTTLMASAVDRLSLLVWAKSEDARHGRNRPVSILSELNKNDDEKIVAFDSADDFWRARRAILESGDS